MSFIGIEVELRAELELVLTLEQEELLWKQKSRELWLASGDRNTSFFHASSIVRRKRNKVEALRIDDDNWVAEKSELERLAVGFFTNLYHLPACDRVPITTPRGGFPALSHEDLVSLSAPFCSQEIHTMVRKMGALKSPGSDGFQPIFFQKCWNIVGSSVVASVQSFFATGKLPVGLNETLITLIAKVNKPELISQFRPIALCNVVYKVITKCMVGRIQRIIPRIISPLQGSFVPGRFITDNIIIAQEVVTAMHKKQGAKGWMLLKLDLEKAYDKLRWDFVEDSLSDAGFPCSWIHWIRECISSSSLRLIWNGEVTESFVPSRGIRQGDPISPYLFVICIERLSQMILRAVGSGDWKPITVSRGGPKLSHILFADDIMLFAEASVPQLSVILGILDIFCKSSGLKISAAKSRIFLSPNVRSGLARRLHDMSGFSITHDLGSYLGMPIMHSRVNKASFEPLIDKIAVKMNGWKSRMLSFAGRVTLAKSVLSSIPVFTMATVMLPASVSRRIDSLISGFIWGSSASGRRMHLVSWAEVCRAKGNGGLGLRSMADLNLAIVGKLGWRFLMEDNKPWVEVLNSKYVRNGVGAAHGSHIWRSIKSGVRNVVSPGCRWLLGDGKSILFWLDVWILDSKLVDLAVQPVSRELLHLPVSSFWNHGSGWRWEVLSSLLQPSVLMRLAAVAVSSEPDARDDLSWSLTSHGGYSVASGYSLVHSEGASADSRVFKAVWKLKVPERVRTFIWLVILGKVMTNDERVRRHLSSDACCVVCPSLVESLDHLFRKCPSACALWNGCNGPVGSSGSAGDSYACWCRVNLLSNENIDGIGPWSAIFACGLWWLWKWRNEKVFTGKDFLGCRAAVVLNFARDYCSASGSSCSPPSVRSEVMICWTRPRDGWLKVNSDGAVSGLGVASAGGVLRDSDGIWQGGFVHHIGCCSVPAAELWGILQGLRLAWERGFRRVIIESDSLLAVSLINRRALERCHPLFSLVSQCQGFLRRDWSIQFRHIFREANAVADHLAGLASSFPIGFHVLDTFPSSASYFLSADMRGCAFPRMTL